VFGVQDKAEIEKVRFFRRILFVRAERVQKVLGKGDIITRIVEDKAFAVVVVPFDGKGVRYDNRGARGQFHAVAHHIGQPAAVGVGVIGV
jgi:hypothetical protein